MYKGARLMKRTYLFSLLLTAIVVLSACGDKIAVKKTEQLVPEPVLVDLTVPVKTEVGHEIEFSALVSQDDEIVMDADEVKFEVLNETSGEKKMLAAEFKADEYSTTFTFDRGGSYSITSHVTARDMHTMPSKVIEVVGGEEKPPSSEDLTATADGGHHHHGSTIQFENGIAKAGEKTALASSVIYEEAPLTEAQVRFEIWKDGSEQHDWVKTSEQKAGKYEGSYKFETSGKYFVQVHVEKGIEIHNHVLKEYIVE